MGSNTIMVCIPGYHSIQYTYILVSIPILVYDMVVTITIIMILWLVIWLVVSTPLKNMKVSWNISIPNIWKNQKFMFETTNK